MAQLHTDPDWQGIATNVTRKGTTKSQLQSKTKTNSKYNMYNMTQRIKTHTRKWPNHTYM